MRERIAILAKFDEARLGRRKAGLGRNKTKNLREKKQNWEGRKRVGLDKRKRIALLAENG